MRRLPFYALTLALMACVVFIAWSEQIADDWALFPCVVWVLLWVSE